MSEENRDPVILSKAKFEEELRKIFQFIDGRKQRDYNPDSREFAFFVLAQEFWPEMVETIFEKYEFLCSGVAAIFRRK